MKYKGITIHKNTKCKTWYTRFRRNNKQYYISGKTQLKCMLALKRALDNIKVKEKPKRTPESKKRTSTTFMQWYETWVTRFKSDVKPETLRVYETNLKKLGEIKQWSIADITAFDIDNLLQKETKPRAKQKLYEFLKPIFTKAKDYKIIPENIFDVIEKPKHTRSEGVALTQAQQEEFIKLCDNNKYGNLFKFILYQGLRIGEALGLNYTDIDFKNKKVSINKQLTPQGVVNNTKNEQSTRVIPLFDKSIGLIPEICEEKRIWDINYKITNTNFHKIIDNTNLPAISIHDLRHTFITNCQNKGIPEYVIQSIVGHEIGSKVTRQVYTHFNLEDNLSYIDKINE